MEEGDKNMMEGSGPEVADSEMASESGAADGVAGALRLAAGSEETTWA